MPQFIRPHILLEGHTETFPYTSNLSGRGIPVRTNVNPETHGPRLREEFEQAVVDFDPDGDFVYISFVSDYDFYLELDKFTDTAGNLRLASFKEIISFDEDDGTEYIQVEATVYLNKKAISQFLRKLDSYTALRTKKGNPRYQSLIANIELIKAATLESFWQEPGENFPPQDEVRWWEIWITRVANENPLNAKQRLQEFIDDQQVTIGERLLVFPEHIVFLVRASAEVLSNTILYSDQLSELREPRETAEFFTYLDKPEQQQWIDDLKGRVVDRRDNLSICLLDTGVNRVNPLLEDLIENRHLDSVNPAWTRADTGGPHGHGTPMAGLTFYGDLTDAFAVNTPIEVYHFLESIKLIERGQPHRPEVYGSVTQEAVARAEVIHPDNKRVVCMPVTSEEFEYNGRPSSWSSAIDQLLFSVASGDRRSTLFFVSSGNVQMGDWINYPLRNDELSIHDPAQSFNAITVGGFTAKATINNQQFPNAELLAKRGGMAPSNTTSINWEREWCRKPDIVMEAGNAGIHNGGVIDPDSLQLLTTAVGGVGRPWLTTFGDTSAATALASKFGIELTFNYPAYWPETIRGLMIHSAYWTNVMLGNRRLRQLAGDDKKKLLSRVGYGVPNMQVARDSANNSLTLIAQRELKPYKLEGGRVKTDEFHLFDLPWPVEALTELFNTEVRLSITLSYFIEPNPGSRSQQKAASYRSHGLRFKMIDSGESVQAFRARVSRAMKDADYQQEGHEDWVLGSQARDKGSIHKDYWEGRAVDLVLKNKIAVYPVNGWWRTRKKLARYDETIRYCLIVNILTPDVDIDIYTPVINVINIPI
jgi:hypothetical protein